MKQRNLSNVANANLSRLVHIHPLQGNADDDDRAQNHWAGKGLSPRRQRVIYDGRFLFEDGHFQGCGVVENRFLHIFPLPEFVEQQNGAE